MSGEGSAFLAIDLGAESGRGVVGRISDERLSLTEIHRFPNTPVRLLGHLHWDVLNLHREIVNAIGAAQRATPLSGVGIDTWGVDFGLLAADGSLLGNPYHYRDSRTDGMMEVAYALVPRERIFAQTGIQFMQLNTVYQLLAMRKAGSPLLAHTQLLLMMGELFTYFLTGEKVAEFTNATTSQAYNPLAGAWADDLLAELGIPRHIFPPVVQPGTQVGCLRPDIAAETGAHGLPVYVPAVHDTASAIAAVPLQGPDSCYISSGTWSLMGVEVDRPIINAASLAANMTNEGGVAGRFCLLKNIMGMWLLQECRRTWEQEGVRLDYAALQEMAKASPSRVTLLDPDHPDFFAPGDMPARICAYARRTGQPVPTDRGAMARCILESLALKYRQVLDTLEQLTGRSIKYIHIVGGGSQNALLNQLTADVTGRTVIAGPVEATAAGNVLVQAMAAGLVNSIAEGRELIRRSFSLTEYTPQGDGGWDEFYERFVALQS